MTYMQPKPKIHLNAILVLESIFNPRIKIMGSITKATSQHNATILPKYIINAIAL